MVQYSYVKRTRDVIISREDKRRRVGYGRLDPLLPSFNLRTYPYSMAFLKWSHLLHFFSIKSNHCMHVRLVGNVFSCSYGNMGWKYLCKSYKIPFFYGQKLCELYFFLSSHILWRLPLALMQILNLIDFFSWCSFHWHYCTRV